MHAALIGRGGVKYQFMPMFWGDFFANTLHLTAQEIGAYVLLIGHAWENNGVIPFDRAQRIARVDNRHWRSVRAVLEPFFKLEAATEALPRRYVHGRVQSEHAKADEISNKRKGAALNLHSKTTTFAPVLHPPSTTTATFIESSLGKGREVPQASVVPAAPVNYRDPGNDYRSPPAQKSEPLTDEQRRARALLAAKTESTARKDAHHERQATDNAESHADADAARTATAKP